MKKVGDHVRKIMKEKGYTMLEGPLLVIVHYRLPTRQKCNAWMRAIKHMHPHDRRPDGDNLEKYSNDALNGILWKDDCAISVCLRIKSFVNAPKGEIVLHVRKLETAPIDVETIRAALMDVLTENFLTGVI